MLSLIKHSDELMCHNTRLINALLARCHVYVLTSLTRGKRVALLLILDLVAVRVEVISNFVDCTVCSSNQGAKKLQFLSGCNF